MANYITDIIELYEADIQKVTHCGMDLQFIKEQTPELCLAAVQQNEQALEYVKVQTPELCLAAVQQNGYALEYVKVQTSEICLAAVQQNGYALHFVKEQTPELGLAAVNSPFPFPKALLRNLQLKKK